MPERFDPTSESPKVDVSGGQGLQVGEGNDQVNHYIGTYVHHQVIDGKHSSPGDVATDVKPESSHTVSFQRPGIFSLRPPLGNLPTRIRGRDQLLDTLKSHLFDRPDRIQVLHGLGGCGKTTVALGLARHARERGYAVYWVSAAGEDRLTTGMRELARELGAPNSEIDDAWSGLTSGMDLVWRYLDSASNPWLLVIDNSDVPMRLAAYEGTPGDGTGWARSSSKGLTLVTSRIGSIETWGQSAERHLVDVLSSDDGAEILIDLAGQAGTRDEARELAARLGGLPLAIRLAGSYLARSSRGAGILRHRNQGPSGLRTFVTYATALGTLGTDLLDEGAVHSSTEAQLEQAHRQLVNRTWEISLDLLRDQGFPEARTIMRLLSCFASAPFPVDLIDTGLLTERGLLPGATQAIQFERAIESLVDFSLLDVVVVSDTVCLVAHRVVLEANAHWLAGAAPGEQSSVWIVAASILSGGVELAPELPANWQRWRLLTPHIWAAVAAVPAVDDALLSEVLAVGLFAFAYLHFSANYEDATSLAHILMARCEPLDDDHPVCLSIRHRYALINATSETELDEFAEILSRQRRILGDENPETLTTRHNWAAALASAGRLAEAETELRSVLDARRRILGPANPYTLITQSEIAEVMEGRGHSEEASSEYQDMIKHLESAEHGDRRFVPIEARHQMAHILDSAKKYPDAEIEYRSLLSQLEEMSATDSGLYRDMLVCLGRNLGAQRRFPDAVAELDKALGLLGLPGIEQGVNAAVVLGLRHQRGDFLHGSGRYDEAVAEIRAVLETREQDGAPVDSVILQERHCLAHSLEKQGNAPEALSQLQNVVSSYASILSVSDAPLRAAANCCAEMLRRQGLWAEAERQYESVLHGQIEALGAENSETLVTKFRLAQVRQAKGAVSKDETLAAYDSIAAKQQELVGGDHNRTRLVRRERERLAEQESG